MKVKMYNEEGLCAMTVTKENNLYNELRILLGYIDMNYFIHEFAK